MMHESESDVSGSLNDSLKNLRDVFVLDGEKVVASRGLLESGERDSIGNESLASGKIDGDAINVVAR